jgi:dTDP-4-dehydrorhamnose 3,5-epimerase
MLEIRPAKIEGVRLIRPTARSDRRGRFVKTMREDIFSKHGIPTTFAEQYYSMSSKDVLRGLHFQTPPHDHYKLVTCIEGEAFDVVVDLRRGSPTFGQHQSFELSGADGDSVFVPSGCAHGFYVRSAAAIMLYSVSSLYAPSHDSGIRWDSVGISWPAQTPIISERDAALVRFPDFETPFELSSNAAMSP